MYKKLNYLLISLLILLLIPITCFAQEESNLQIEEEYFTAKVLEIIEDSHYEIAGFKQPYQVLKVIFLEGSEKDTTKIIEYGKGTHVNENSRLKKGQKVIVFKTNNSETTDYLITDHYRLSNIYLLVLFFILLTIVIAKYKGFLSILGLAITILILIYYIAPQIVSGQDPVTTVLIGSIFIIIFSIVLSHGFNKKTALATISTILALSLAIIISKIFISYASLFGTGSEDAMFLQFGELSHIDLKGLLLAGIIIGTLGVLDDITTTQTTAVYELSEANKTFTFKDLYKKGMSIGKEHTVSMVNTLFLAYAGASFPLLIYMTINKDYPFWIILNSEFLIEEIVRTLSGSIALIAAVPLTTAIAAYVFKKK